MDCKSVISSFIDLHFDYIKEFYPPFNPLIQNAGQYNFILSRV